MTTNQTDWVEDAESGVAVREVGGELQVRAITDDGYDRIAHAIEASGASWRYMHEMRRAHGVTRMGLANLMSFEIDAAHRLAFARALSPIAEPNTLRVAFDAASERREVSP